MRNLKAKRETVVQEMGSITASPEGANGDLSEAQEMRFHNLKVDLEKLEKQIERQQILDDADRRAQGVTVGGGYRGGDDFESRAQQASLLKICAAQAGEQVDIGLERELSQEMERRMGVKAQGVFFPMETRVVTTDAPESGPGGTLIPTTYRPQDFMDRLRNASILNQVGATTLTGLTGPTTIPGLKSSVSTGWVAENTALTPSDQAYRSVTLTQRHCGVIAEASRNMLQSAVPAIENLFQSDMAAQLAEALDIAAINGPGGVAPTGLLKMTGLSTVAGGGALTYENLVDLAALPENANSVGSGYLTNTAIKAALLKIKTTDDLPVGLSTLFGGYPHFFSNSVPAATVLFGRWSDLLIGVWSGLDILVNPYESTAYAKGNVMIRAMMTVDIQVRHLESFAAITDAA